MLRSLGDEEIRQKYEARMREMFEKYNIPEEEGFDAVNQIVDYALSLKLEDRDGIPED